MSVADQFLQVLKWHETGSVFPAKNVLVTGKSRGGGGGEGKVDNTRLESDTRITWQSIC